MATGGIAKPSLGPPMHGHHDPDPPACTSNAKAHMSAPSRAQPLPVLGGIPGLSLGCIWVWTAYGGGGDYRDQRMIRGMFKSLVFKEMVSVRYSAAKERDMPLFRTLQWSWFAVAIFYAYGDFLHEFVLQHRALLWLSPMTMYHAWFSFVLYCCVFVVSVLTLKKGLYKYQVRVRLKPRQKRRVVAVIPQADICSGLGEHLTSKKVGGASSVNDQ